MQSTQGDWKYMEGPVVNTWLMQNAIRSPEGLILIHFWAVGIKVYVASKGRFVAHNARLPMPQNVNIELP